MFSRISKRARVVVTEISDLRHNIPTVQDQMKTRFDSLKNDFMEISKQLDASTDQTELINKIQKHVKDDQTRKQKHQLISKLVKIHAEEVKDLKEAKVSKLKSMEQSQSEMEKKISRIDQKIEVLQKELEKLGSERKSRTNKHSLHLLDLENDLR